ncbi:uncharacterized protein VP01_956g7 [Puccinia sorghi]|uniref:Uncharacterized protein n=1 Tax=Puccinia sorghi TaxID=27349 RepID=A0A0L6U684_9BASI|nr:uncharacterized protein VP01_956g7 [Puccinia sorghi]
MLPSASTYYECCGKDSTGEPKQSLLAADMPPRPSPDYEYYYARLIAAILFVTVQFFQSAPHTDINTTYTEWFKHQTTAKFRSNVLQKSKSLPVKSSAELLGLAIDAIHNNALLKGPCLKVLLAVDEAGAMLVAPNKNEVSFFLDTTSRVSNFCPTNREDNSSRAIGARGAPPIKLFAPIYKINTFDQMVPSDPPKTWKELFLPDRLCRYGVPFFSIYLNDLKETHTVTNSNPLYAIPAMANFALKKLLCCEDVNGALKLTEVRALALLGPTIGVPLHGQSHLNVDLTASHAAHCGYLDPTRETSVLCQGHAAKGNAGELASRIILLCAMNKTADDIKIKERKGAHQPNNPNQSAPATLPVDSTAFPSPVPVAQFLPTLTGIVQELQFGTISREVGGKLLREGMMFWNHFQHCLSTPTPGSLMEGMERGLAMQCHDQQASFDQLLCRST